jgi:UPF0042 nucleotide-binding protein
MTGLTQRLLLITGMSGAGKTTALKALEDIGYECIDHLPLHLLIRLLNAPVSDGEADKRPLAIGIDVRTRDFDSGSLIALVDRLQARGAVDAKLVFLFSDDEELRRRYTATRHRHPLAVDVPVIDGIVRERQMLAPVKTRADLAIDTTGLAPGDLKRTIEGYFGSADRRRLTISIISFSYRSGLPRDADLVLDVRFLNNPFYVTELRSLTGRDPAIDAFVTADASFPLFFERLSGLLEPLLPRYVAEGKSYLTIAIGCTGGRHRSVCIAERLAGRLTEQGEEVRLHHRDLDRSAG